MTEASMAVWQSESWQALSLPQFEQLSLCIIMSKSYSFACSHALDSWRVAWLEAGVPILRAIDLSSCRFQVWTSRYMADVFGVRLIVQLVKRKLLNWIIWCRRSQNQYWASVSWTSAVCNCSEACHYQQNVIFSALIFLHQKCLCHRHPQ